MKSIRCRWAKHPLELLYHDQEWGRPVHDDRVLFEFLILEGAQAGLSWLTVLKKREAYRKAFNQFDPKKIAKYDSKKVQSLLKNPDIIRNRLKIASAIQNARAFLAVQKDQGSFDRYIWQFVGGVQKVNAWKTMRTVPCTSQESDAMSKDLKKRGFNFVGTTICYSFMQAVGLVNDHTIDCFRYRQVGKKPL